MDTPIYGDMICDERGRTLNAENVTFLIEEGIPEGRTTCGPCAKEEDPEVWGYEEFDIASTEM